MTTNTLPIRSNGRRACFASLPRELKDEIWSYLLITPNCVSYTTRRGVEVFDKNNIEHNLKVFHDSDREIAQAARELFYLNNTIRLDILDLPNLLCSTSQITRTSQRIGGKNPSFDATLWVKRLIIRIGLCNSDYETTASSSTFFAMQLPRLLDCPRLQTVILDVEGDNKPFPLSSCKDTLKALKKKLGKGLRIYHDMGWSYGNPPTSSDWRTDISGIYEVDVWIRSSTG